MKKTLALGLLAGLLFVGISEEAHSFFGKKKDKKPRVAVISKGYQHEFWRTVEAGTKKGADQYDLDTYFIGPEKESEVGKQVAMVENAINQRVDVIALAPLDANALIPVVTRAKQAGIPVVTFDSGLNTDIPQSFIATDNVEGGRIAGEELAKLVDYEGKVVILAHNAGTSTAIDREAGAKEVLKKYPNIQVLNTQFTDGDRSKALAITQDLLMANPDLKGIYGTNESMVGVARAIEEKGLEGKVALIGYDASRDQVRYLQNGVMNGTVSQDPFNMGYLTIKAAAEILEGKEVSKRVDTGATYVTLENFDDVDVQKLIYPFGK